MLSVGIEGRERLLAGEDRVERLHDRARPLAQLIAVAALRDAEHLGDHDEGQREREVGDEVHRSGAARGDVVEVLVDELLHARVQLLDRARREHLRHEPAQAVVVGRVEVEHRVRLAARPSLLEHRLEILVDRVGDRPGVCAPRR